jgi:beta-mannanase
VYHCAQAEVRPESVSSNKVDWEGIEKYTKASGHRPKMIMHYITLDPFGFEILKDSIFEISHQPHDYIAQIGLTFYRHPQNKNVSYHKDLTPEIVGGVLDANIRELAQLLAKMKIPVFLRPGFEFGGDGYGQYASKKHWTRAWKRIYDIFKKEGAENVAFVWNTLDARDFIDYYPGDEYVDWWAVNIFNNNADKDEFATMFIKEAAKHKKPVMIAESTPRYIGSINGAVSWYAWYGPYFKLLSNYPHLKAFCYINASWRDYWDNTFKYDSRIQSDKYVFENFRKELSDTKFIHSDMSKQK